MFIINFLQIIYYKFFNVYIRFPMLLCPVPTAGSLDAESQYHTSPPRQFSTYGKFNDFKHLIIEI